MGYFSAALFASVGVLAYACNVWNSTKGYHGAFVFDEVAVMFALAAIISAGASTFLRDIAAKSLAMGAMALAYILIASYVSMSFSVTEIARMIDGNASEAVAHNARIERAEKRAAALKAEASAEAARGGCGPRCRELLRDAKAAQEDLNALGAPMPVDPVGTRFQEMTNGLITSEKHRIALPVIFAAMIEAGGPLSMIVASLLFGSRPRRQRVEVITPEPVDPIVRALEVAGPSCNRDLARLVGMDERRVSERAKMLEHSGRIVSQRSGKMRVYALA